MTGVHRLVVQILYGSGLRQTECLELRGKDLDFGQQQIIVRSGKGGKDRVTPMPQSLIEPLQEHLRIVQRTHDSRRFEPDSGASVEDKTMRQHFRR
jgi:integrase